MRNVHPVGYLRPVGARLSLAVLGPPKTLLDGEPVTAFKTQKVLALLAFLAVEAAHPHRREELCGLFWPDQTDASARDNLRVTLYRLRQALREDAHAAHAPFVTSTRDAAQFNPRSDHWLDLADFNGLMAECRDHAHERMETCAECSLRLAKAVSLYRGDFLHGMSLADSAAFEEWVLVQREALRRQVLSASETLSAYHQQRGDYEALGREAHRQLALEPWHEPAHRQLMRGLALTGERNAALAQYEACRRVLAQELGIEPEAETRALVERIRAGELSPVALTSQPPAHTLPAHLAPFVGRESELVEIASQLQQPGVRLLTLVGAGGMGKTRLAVEAARARLNDYPHGVFFVSLAPLVEAGSIPSAIAAALGLSLHEGDPQHALLRALREKRLLLILDNFEHVLAGANLVVELLQAAPQVQIIATSRERLRVRGEKLYAVLGMDYAPDATLAQAATSSAVRLFVQSARLAQTHFKLSEANRAAVLRLCRLVDGMPLGLELAAAWVDSLTVEEIAAAIERSADFLAFDWQDAPARQRSMRAVFAWSWQLLSDVERQVFRQLTVFRGGFTREAAQAVVGGASVRVLTSLEHKSLLRHTGGRYEMHELLRQFAAEQLAAAADARAAVEAQHGTFYLAFVAGRERRMARDEPRLAVAEIQAELDNVRQAWSWASAHAHLAELDRSASGLSYFYVYVGPYAEAEQTFTLAAEQAEQAEQVLARLDQMGDAAAAAAAAVAAAEAHHCQRVASKLLAIRASFTVVQNKSDQALSIAQRAIELSQMSGEPEGQIVSLIVQAEARYRKTQYPEARAVIAQALAQIRQNAHAPSEAVLDSEWRALRWLGLMALTLDDFADAQTYLAQGLQICHTLGKLRGQGILLFEMGRAAQGAGDYSAAANHYQNALSLTPRIGYRGLESILQLLLGDVLRLQGNYAAAQTLMTRALASFREIGERMDEATGLGYLGHLADALGDDAQARTWLDEAVQLSRDLGAREPEMDALMFLAQHCHRVGEDELALTYAEQGWQSVREVGGRSRQARAQVILGHVYSGLRRLGEAETAYRQALALYRQLGDTHVAVAAEPRAGLAAIALDQNSKPALAQVEEVAEIVNVLVEHPHAGLDEPFDIYLICYRVLNAHDDPRARTVLQTAHSLLRDYASHITDDALRHSFVENVATHCELQQAFAEATLAEPTST